MRLQVLRSFSKVATLFLPYMNFIKAKRGDEEDQGGRDSCRPAWEVVPVQPQGALREPRHQGSQEVRLPLILSGPSQRKLRGGMRCRRKPRTQTLIVRTP